jgi:hypothetical protein
MPRTSLPLTGVRIASPCSASWEEMKGDNRVRTCDLCQLRVFNLSGMSQREAEELIAKAEGRLCVRLYRRADGTVITADCPIGISALRQAIWRAIGYGAGAAALLFAYLAGMVSSMSETPAGWGSDPDWMQDWMQHGSPHPLMGLIAPPSKELPLEQGKSGP